MQGQPAKNKQKKGVKNMEKQHNNLLIRIKKEGKGITLIALVITIVLNAFAWS